MTASRSMESALHFYRALKVYPSPSDLIRIYDQTISKPILDLLAEMIAVDPDLRINSAPPQMPDNLEALFGPGGVPGMPVAGLD